MKISMSPAPTVSPGLPELAAALISYLLLLGLIGLLLIQITDEHAGLRGIVGMATNGVAGIFALSAAFVLRIRELRAFGFQGVERRWLFAGAVLGVVAIGLSLLIEHAYSLFVTGVNTQADFQAAARGGPLALIVIIFTGAVLTPLGEEIVFRGVIANALNRYGVWPGVVGSAAIFAVVHGPSVIMFDAFMVGILAGALFRKTNAVWPGLVLHVTYNGIWLLIYSLP